jgi:general L-amino acid transport system permease protein
MLIRVFCAVTIEVVRGVPLLTILFCAAVVAPLALPDVISPITINRVILAMALFYACYQAEVIRGGMRAIRATEIEGAQALGLKPVQVTALIVLPQAIRFTIPATVNLVVVAFKDTSLVVIVGLFDFLASANTAIASDAWAPFFAEIYLVVALVFLIITNGLTWLGRLAERKLAVLR